MSICWAEHRGVRWLEFRDNASKVGANRMRLNVMGQSIVSRLWVQMMELTEGEVGVES